MKIKKIITFYLNKSVIYVYDDFFIFSAKIYVFVYIFLQNNMVTRLPIVLTIWELLTRKQNTSFCQFAIFGRANIYHLRRGGTEEEEEYFVTIQLLVKFSHPNILQYNVKTLIEKHGSMFTNFQRK